MKRYYDRTPSGASSDHAGGETRCRTLHYPVIPAQAGVQGEPVQSTPQVRRKGNVRKRG